MPRDMSHHTWWVMPWGALGFSLIEGVLLVISRHREFANLWELQWGSLGILPATTLIALSVGLGCGVLVGGALSSRPVVRGVAAAAAAVLAAWLGYELTFGRHFDLWWRRVGFIAVLAISAAGGSYFGGPRLKREIETRPRLSACAALLAALACLAINRFVLVRLYPAFHLALAVGSFFWAGVAALSYHASWQRRSGRSWSPRAWGIALGAGWVLAAGLLVPAARRLSRFDNFRWVVTENAPLLGLSIQVSAWVAPPKELTSDLPSASPEEGAVHARLGLEDRDVLLITVDALRADHVGAYGYTRPTTPNLDRLAAEGVRFDRAYCATPHTSYSVTSLLTGKYMRPLLLQGLGADSETWADVLRRYGYRTAAFYPPAIFFIDNERFAAFDQRQLGFEYQKREFLEGAPRVEQVANYLASVDGTQRVFVWLHLFGPHEPYEVHSEFDFGQSDVDRYDSEIRATDETIGQVVDLFRKRSPRGIVLVTADHGEEFGDHGGRYHGSSVYEEQARVPLVVSAPGLPTRVVRQPVQTIDLMPTVLSALDIPTRPRIRGRDLGRWLTPELPPEGMGAGFAFAETDEQALLAEGSHRLICLRRVGACQLFDIDTDPSQRKDVSREYPDILDRLRERLRRLNSDHGQFEISGARAEGLRWPGPILRGLAGDVDAALEVAGLLDDADVAVRRKAAEVLFELAAGPVTASNLRQAPARSILDDVATPLRLALQRDEDYEVRAYSALALTRLGEGAALTRELLESEEVHWRRRAALALAATGDRRGMQELLGWWLDKTPKPFEVSAQLVAAFARGKVKDAVWALTQALSEVRLRPLIVAALGEIGDESAVNGLLSQFKREPYQTNRTLLAEALLQLGAGEELAVPLRRWLGVGEPLEDGLGIAVRAKVLEHVGGPSNNDLRRLRQNINLGQLIQIVVPKAGNGRGIRLLARVTNASSSPLTLRVGVPRQGVFTFDEQGKLKTSRKIPELDATKQLTLVVPPARDPIEIHGIVPDSMGLRPGRSSYVVAFAEHGVAIDALAFAPLYDELQAGNGATGSPDE